MALTALVLLLSLASSALQLDPIYHITVNSSWPKPSKNSHLGDLRARLDISALSDKTKIEAQIFWRRRDIKYTNASVYVTDEHGIQLPVASASGNNDCVLVSFNAASAQSSDVLVYWLPYFESGNDAHLHFSWDNTSGIVQWSDSVCSAPSSPVASVLQLETRDEFHGFKMEEMQATSFELQQIASQSESLPFLMFVDTRDHPSRIWTGINTVPALWVHRGPANFANKVFELPFALKGEHMMFQVGVFAHQQGLKNLSYTFTSNATGSNITCYNLEGTDDKGISFLHQDFELEQRHISVLWLGWTVSKETAAGMYVGTLTLHAAGGVSSSVDVSMRVLDSAVNVKDDANVTSLRRMRWLNSQRGLDKSVPKPYTPLSAVRQNTTLLIALVNKNITVDLQTGQIAQVQTLYTRRARTGEFRKQYQSLQSPVSLEVTSSSGAPIQLNYVTSSFMAEPDEVTWTSTLLSQDGNLQVTVSGTVGFDSYANMVVNHTALKQSVSLLNASLSLAFHHDIAQYLVGLGQPPSPVASKDFDWHWSLSRGDCSLWVGDVNAGMYVMPRGASAVWESPMFGKDFATIPYIPPTWSSRNGTAGGGMFSSASSSVQLFSGPQQILVGKPYVLYYDIAATPARPLNLTKHWGQRYFQVGYGTNYITPQELHAVNVTVITLHQGTPGVINGSLVNPYINYPFVPDTIELMENYTRQANDIGMAVKFYYTVRELSNHAAELYPLLSLRGEVIIDTNPYFIPQPGYCQDADCHGGDVYLQQHLIQNYSACWQQGLSNGEIDAAVCDIGTSRWFNYYVEGLYWSVSQPPYINGIYFDGINFDRDSIRRVRKAANAAAIDTKSSFSPLLDLHTGYDSIRPPSLAYLSHMAYMDSLWNGEGFDFGADPIYWLVEVSGYIHGLTGDRLGGGSVYDIRGMLFGMTQRNAATASTVWNLWDRVKIEDMQQIGFWDPEPIVSINGSQAPGPKCMSAYTVSHGSYHEACGGASGSIGFGAGCGPQNPPQLPNMTAEQVEEHCCQMQAQGKSCVGFSIYNKAAGQPTHGCIKINAGCGVQKNADYDGYLLQVACNASANVKATVYTDFATRALVVVSSWCSSNVSAALDIDWDALGLDANSARASLPNLPGIQRGQASFDLTQPLNLAADAGIIILIEAP